MKILDLRDAVKAHLKDAEQTVKTQMLNFKARRDAIQEAGIWKKAGSHKHVVRLFEAHMEHGVAFLVMERCEKPLIHFLREGATEPFLTERSWAKALLQILFACDHIHCMQVVHRDLKPGNFVVNAGVVKMCDFGEAEVIPADKEGVAGIAGTSPYMAPEMLQGKVYTSTVDIFSVGVMAYLILFGNFPYIGNSAKAMRQAIRDGEEGPSYVPEHGVHQATPEAKALTVALLHRDPTCRPTAKEAQEMSFFQPSDKPMPSLVPALDAAAANGAFFEKTCSKDDLDAWLDHLQEEKRSTSEDSTLPGSLTSSQGGRSAQSEDS